MFNVSMMWVLHPGQPPQYQHDEDIAYQNPMLI